MKSAAGHCPHLGGVALRTLTVQANHAGATTESLHKALHAARIRGSELADQIQKLRAELARVKIELKHQREGGFASCQQYEDSTAGKRKPTDDLTPTGVIDESTHEIRSDQTLIRAGAAGNFFVARRWPLDAGMFNA